MSTTQPIIKEFVASGFDNSVLTAGYELGPNHSWCWLQVQRSGIVNNTLYIDGGRMGFTNATTGFEVLNTKLLTLDLTKPFEWRSPSIKFIQKPKYVPSTQWGSLFVNHPSIGEFSTYGGLYKRDLTTKPDRTLASGAISWAFTPPTAWTQLASTGDTTLDFWNGAATTANTTGFYLGGQANSLSTVVTTPAYSRRLLSVKGNVWRVMDLPDRLGFIQAAFFEYVPVKGRAGVLLAFGGVKLAEETVATKTESELPKMDEINVYDLETEKWMMQKTSGGPPVRRHRGCSAAFRAEDGSSHNIYIYGGQTTNSDDDNTPGTNDVWILSLPSFTWVKALAGDDNLRVSRHTCSPSGRHLLSVGGIVSENVRNPRKSQCSPLLNVFDATSLKWLTGTIPADTVYGVPGVLSSVIGGDSKGGAEKLAPANGWSSPQLEAIFASGFAGADVVTKALNDKDGGNKDGAGGNSGNSGNGGNGGNSGSGGKGTGGGLATGAIAGIAVGAAAVVVGLALLWFLVRRRRRRTNKTQDETLVGGTPELHGHTGYWRPIHTSPTELGAGKDPGSQYAGAYEPVAMNKLGSQAPTEVGDGFAVELDAENAARRT